MESIKFGEEVKGECGVCGGEIREKIVELYEALSSDVYGPGSKMKNIGEGTDGLVCAKCGIKYEFVPSAKAMFDVAASRLALSKIA